jgi:hypothetical protein
MKFTGLLARETPQNAFIGAVLITGSIRQAELAIQKSASDLGAGSIPGDQFFRKVIQCSLEMEAEAFAQKFREFGCARSILPDDLACLLELPRALRRCFVLSTLVCLPPAVCADLLDIEVTQVSRRTRAAMRDLEEIRRGSCLGASDLSAGGESEDKVSFDLRPSLVPIAFV